MEDKGHGETTMETLKQDLTGLVVDRTIMATLKQDPVGSVEVMVQCRHLVLMPTSRGAAIRRARRVLNLSVVPDNFRLVSRPGDPFQPRGRRGVKAQSVQNQQEVPVNGQARRSQEEGGILVK